MSSQIHSSAVVAPGAVIGEGCTVGPYTIIGPHVRLGSGNRIGPHVVLDGHTVLGDDNVVFQFASVGAPPQDLKYRGEASTLTIGSRNIIREYVTLQPGTSGGGMRTVIGDDNLFMANSHIGHDSSIGNRNVFANSAAIAGHVTIRDKVTVGGLSGIHQFVVIGDQAIIGGGAMVAKDIPPYTLAQGDRARLVGLNKIGLERHGMTAEEIGRLKKLYREVFFGEGVLHERVQMLRERNLDFPPALSFLEFIAASKRGVAAVRRGGSSSEDE